ncbi:MAG: HAMP domain-containing histidine kinase [Reichenbachiella sp.]
MNRRAFRLLIVLAVISIAATLAVQFYWVHQAFTIRDYQFSSNVKSALLQTSIQLCDIYNQEVAASVVEQVSSNLYVVNLNNKIDPETLEPLLITEFDQRGITESFEYSIYDCSNDALVYGNHIAMSDSYASLKEKRFDLSKLEQDEYYFGIYFPNKAANIVSIMGVWVFSSATLLLVVVFFAVSLLFINRQRKLSELQRDFVDNMTHEFKTPISTIALSAEVLKSPEIRTDKNRLLKYAGIIEKESMKLQHHVDRILQMSNSNQSQLDLNNERVELAGFLEEIIASYLLSHEHVNIELNIPKRRVYCELDRLHMTNVISNLLDNAEKYHDSNPHIVIEVAELDGHVRIDVGDDGPGMDSKFLSSIFNKFYRIPTGNLHNVKGFGLGLFYVKLVVEAHGGEIAASSEPGFGTSIIMNLPIST